MSYAHHYDVMSACNGILMSCVLGALYFQLRSSRILVFWVRTFADLVQLSKLQVQTCLFLCVCMRACIVVCARVCDCLGGRMGG
jgi:hypothetical protein